MTTKAIDYLVCPFPRAAATIQDGPARAHESTPIKFPERFMAVTTERRREAREGNVRTSAALALVALLAASPAQAQSHQTTGNHPGCTTQDLLRQFQRALDEGDKEAKEHLMKNGCVVVHSGHRVTVLESDGRVSRIRVYDLPLQQGEIELWVPSVAVHK